MRKLSMITALLFSLFASPAMAEIIVVATSGDAGLQAGQKLDPTDQISLQQGARITILSKAGAMRVIDGPYSGPVEAQEEAPKAGTAVAQWDAVKTFLGDPDARTEVVGASRSAKVNLFAAPLQHLGRQRRQFRSALYPCLRAGSVAQEPDAASDCFRPRARASGSPIWTGRKGTTLWPCRRLLPRRTAAWLSPSTAICANCRSRFCRKSWKMPPREKLLVWLVDNKCARQAQALIAHVHARTEIR